jgi:murein DD-endopeptidase MepM/ murein hydrolase activator NlpD
LIYPLFHPAQANYRTGARYFGAHRSGGRLHAAVDLIAPHLWPIRAVADGRVIQAPYYFYTGTNALEVSHPGVGTVRYGEIDTHKVVHLAGGSHVKCGQVIAYVGRLDSGSSMLHFELYSGKSSGALTVRGNPPYQRRRDLVNPTSFMDRLYKLTF